MHVFGDASEHFSRVRRLDDVRSQQLVEPEAMGFQPDKGAAKTNGAGDPEADQSEKIANLCQRRAPGQVRPQRPSSIGH
jgi:hypothetical protein